MVPEEHSASTPTGLSVEVKVPQKTTLEAEGLAEADVRDTTVTLPQGVELSPSAANGLHVLLRGPDRLRGPERHHPDQRIHHQISPPARTPRRSARCTSRRHCSPTNWKARSIWQAQDANPFGSLVALYLVAEDPVSGVLVKLAGEGQLDEGTLRVSTTFKNAPQVPFEDLKIELFGGPRASVTTPPFCGGYATDAAFTPWSGTGVVNVLGPPEEFVVSSGAGGGACPAVCSPSALASPPTAQTPRPAPTRPSPWN